MNKVIISADSTCDMPAELKERYGVKVLPLYVTLGDDSLKDGEEVNPEMIYEYVSANNQLPKTSAATIPDYQEWFEGYVKEGYDVLHFNLSSTMSVTHQNAKMAAEEVEGNVYVIDSGNLSAGMSLLILDACDMAAEGKSAEEIYQEILRRIPLVRASFVVDTLDYLKMGGRCSSVAALGTNLLKLHPRIAVVDGKMGVAEKYRGAIENVIVKYAQQMLDQNKDKIVGKRCFVIHTKYNPEAVQKVCDLVKASGLFEEVIENTAGCVITSHCGPGTLGVLFEVTE